MRGTSQSTHIDRTHPLFEFCSTEKQAEVVQLCVVDKLTQTVAAKQLGISQCSVHHRLQGVYKRAAKAGASRLNGFCPTAPAGYAVNKATTLFDGDGNVQKSWVSVNQDKEAQLEILCERLESSLDGVEPFKPTKAPKSHDDDLLSLLTITDFHLGQYAWKDEAGDDWDVNIAKQVFLNSVHDMIKASPRAGTGVLCQLGDFLHFDGLAAVTPSSHHVLDADSRYGKVVDLAMTVMAEAVRMMLKKFGKVVVISAEGNHDISGSIWLRKYLGHMFADEPRLEVIDNEFPYYAYKHGQTMLGFHHGHKVKMAQLHKLFASEPRFRRMWGECDYTYLHVGHYHHERVIEDGGAIAEQHPTLAARDAYAARGGWVSARGAKIITYSKTDGEVARTTVRPRA